MKNISKKKDTTKKRKTMYMVYEEAIERNGDKDIVYFNNTMIEYHAGICDFKNKFDAPKLDFRRLLPENMSEKHVFIMPCGKPDNEQGSKKDIKYDKKITAIYAFVHGTKDNDGYLTIPTLDEDSYFDINPEEYGHFKSDVSRIGSAEATSISTLSAYGAASDFFNKSKKIVPIIHDSRRSRLSGDIRVLTKEKIKEIRLRSVQVEIDGFWEWEDTIVALEGKAYDYEDLKNGTDEVSITWRQLAYLIKYTQKEFKKINSKKRLRYALVGQVNKHPFGKKRVFFICEFESDPNESAYIKFKSIKGYKLPETW